MRGIGEPRSVALDGHVLEAAPPPALEVAAHEPRRLVAAGAQPLDDRDVPRVIGDPVRRGAGQHRRQRPRGGVARGEGVREHCAARAELAHHRHVGESRVGRRLIRAQRLDRDEHDVGVRRAEPRKRREVGERNVVAQILEAEPRHRSARDRTRAPDLECRRRLGPDRDDRDPDRDHREAADRGRDRGPCSPQAVPREVDDPHDRRGDQRRVEHRGVERAEPAAHEQPPQEVDGDDRADHGRHDDHA